MTANNPVPTLADEFDAITTRLLTWRCAHDGLPDVHPAYVRALYGTAFDGDAVLGTWRQLMTRDDFATVDAMNYAQELANRAYLALRDLNQYGVENMLERLVIGDRRFNTMVDRLHTLRVGAHDKMPWLIYYVALLVQVTLEHVHSRDVTRAGGMTGTSHEDDRQLGQLHVLIDLYIEFQDFEAQQATLVIA